MNTWDATLYDQKHSFVFQYGKGVLELLEPQAGEYILDLGCGTGHLTRAIADTGARVLGIDGATSMIEQARQNYPDIEFQVADARTFYMPDTFDAVFSNAVLHWIPEAEQAVQHIATNLKSGGRFVAEFGGKGNIQAIITALRQTFNEIAHIQIQANWFYPSVGEYTSLLEKYGFTVRAAWLIDRPTKLEDGPEGLRTWIKMFRNDWLEALPQETQEQVFTDVENKLRSRLFQDGSWYADYRRLRVVARKELL
ncbi:MAG TPA: methyltransferase domain-containing protein [Ktedonobacteraceae bacterium]|jgi:trans-aconitate 2-methyltransferase